jgi:hypothetical protein
MSTDTEIPFTRTDHPDLNGPEPVQHKFERAGRCGICGKPHKTQRTLQKFVTPFAMHSNTVVTKSDARKDLARDGDEWISKPPYHEPCMYDFMDALEESGLLSEMLPRMQEYLAHKKAQADRVTQLSVVGNGA